MFCINKGVGYSYFIPTQSVQNCVFWIIGPKLLGTDLILSNCYKLNSKDMGCLVSGAVPGSKETFPYSIPISQMRRLRLKNVTISHFPRTKDFGIISFEDKHLWQQS